MTQYVKPQNMTLVRQMTLRDKWHFVCRCSRCQDPTELGTHFSAVLCANRRCAGPVNTTDPFDDDADWRCADCGAVTPVETAQEAVAALDAELDEGAVREGEDVICRLVQCAFT